MVITENQFSFFFMPNSGNWQEMAESVSYDMKKTMVSQYTEP